MRTCRPHKDSAVRSHPTAKWSGTPWGSPAVAGALRLGQAVRDAALVNAAAALLAGDKVENLEQGVELAAEVIDKGYALEKLEQFVNISQQYSNEK